MWVLGISASPRRGGNSELLLDAALEGAAGAGARVEKLVPAELDIRPCPNCDDCRETGVCTRHDDMDLVYPKLQEADRIILASPIFFLSLPASAKVMIDRCQALWIAKYVLHRPPKVPNRKGMFISVCHRNHMSQFRPAIAVVRAWFATLDVYHSQSLLFGGIERKGEILAHPTALEEAYYAAADFVLEG